MNELVVRRLLIDLDTPFAPDWCGGDAFATAFFNALSMSFPFGEQFFIDAVRDGTAGLPAHMQDAHRANVRGFIGQEATHRRIHGLFNAQLERQGLVDHWTPRARQRLRLIEGKDPRHALAITAAIEHFTAMFAEWLLAHPETLDGAEPRLQTLWLWHSAEELEHKTTAFDIYLAAGGTLVWRRRWLRRMTLVFLSNLLRQTAANLRSRGALWKVATWRSGWRLLLSRNGLLRSNAGAWRDYLRPDFHPSQQDSRASAKWLQDNRAQFAVVGG